MKKIYIAIVCCTLILATAQNSTAADRFWVAATSSNFNNTANWSTTSGGTGGASVPDITDIAIFDGGGVGSVALDVNVSVDGLTMASGYSGTITQGSFTVTVGVTGASYSDGIFSGGTANITILGDLTIAGTASFASTSGTLHLRGNYTLSGSGTFSDGNGSVLLKGSLIKTLAGSSTFNNLEFSVAPSSNGAIYEISAGTQLTVNGNLLFSGGNDFIAVNTGVIEAQGDITSTNTALDTVGGGTATILINGTGNQTLTGSGLDAGGKFPNITIDKSSGTMILASTIALGTNSNWAYIQGAIDASSNNSIVSFTRTNTISGSHALHNVRFSPLFAPTSFTVSSGTQLTTSGSLELIGTFIMNINTGEIQALGDVTVTNTGIGGTGGSGKINIVGSGNQTLTGSGIECAGRLPDIDIDKTSGTLFLSSLISLGGDWTYVQGNVDATSNASTVAFCRPAIIDGEGISDVMTFNDITIASTVTIAGTFDVAGDLEINSGAVLDAGSTDISIDGNWDYSGDFNEGTSTVTFNGTSSQTITNSTGSETFFDLVIDKSSGDVILLTPVDVANTLTLTSGRIVSTSTNILTLKDNATVSGASDASFVSGPVAKEGDDAFEYPTGKTSNYRPISMSAPSSTSDRYTAEYFDTEQTFGSNKESSLGDISSCEYWNLDRDNGTSAVSVTLSWNVPPSCEIPPDITDVQVTGWDGTTWVDLDNGGVTGTSSAGTVVTQDPVTSFGPVTLGSEPLPVFTVNDIDVGTTSSFAVLAGGSISATDPIIANGDVGAINAISSNITSADTTDSIFPPNDPVVQQAMIDLNSLIFILDNIAPITTISGTLGPQTLTAGVYEINGPATLNDTLILDGDSTSMFVFVVNGTLSVSSFSTMRLEGVRPNNVYWRVSGDVNFSTNTIFSGLVTSSGNIIVNNVMLGQLSIQAVGNVSFVTGNSRPFNNLFSKIAMPSFASGSCDPVACPCINQPTCNLIRNGCFQDKVGCPKLPGEIELACPWYRATMGEVDYFHYCAVGTSGCSKIHIPDNFVGTQLQKSCEGYSGVQTFTGGQIWFSGRTYLQQPMVDVMEAGKTYYGEFFISLADNSTAATDLIGMSFSSGPVTIYGAGGGGGGPGTPCADPTNLGILPLPFHIQNTAGIITNNTAWTSVSGTYVASGGEDHITIGNFSDDASTASISLTPGTTCYSGTDKSFYYVDEVSVLIVNDAGEDFVICPGGSVILGPSCPLPGATYSWNNGSTLDDDAIPNPTASPTTIGVTTYTVTVTAPDGTVATDDVDVTVIGSATATITPSATTICEGDQVTLDATGGPTYSWSPGGETTPSITASPTTNTTFTVTVQPPGCSPVSNAVSITVDPAPIISGSVINATCGSTDGEIALTITGGSGSYAYSWTGISTSFTSTSEDITGLAGDDYTVIVTDNSTGCSASTTFTVTDAISIAIVSTIDESCDGACDGVAIVTTLGGTPPYVYSWTGSPATFSFGNQIQAFGLCAGGNVVTSTDANGCMATLSVNIDQPGVTCVTTICNGKVTIKGHYPFSTTTCGGNAIVSPCPGEPYGYYMTFKNLDGFNPFSTSPVTILQLVLDPNMSYVSTVINTCGLTQISFTSPLQWEVPDPSVLVAGCVLNVEVSVDCIPDAIGCPPSTTPGIWHSTASILTECSDLSVPLISATFNDGPDQCSCDPNDKEVEPAGCGDLGFISNQELTYTVNFQNVGTGPASDVILRDTIDADLDLSTLQILTSSHTITNTQINQADRELVITFLGIELPAEIDDPIGSNGFITYGVSPFPSLSEGTTIQNSTGIFFDSNVPIITNEVINTIVDDPVVTVDAGPDQIVVPGVQSQECVELEASADGALPPYVLEWSTGETTPDITVCPTTTTDFTVVVNASGCLSEADSVTVFAIDTFCDNNNKKVLVCHVPPGNPSNAHEICINFNAVPAHLAHGDYLGPCLDSSDLDSLILQPQLKTSNVFLSSHPNPFSQTTTIVFSVKDPGIVKLWLPSLNGFEAVKLFEGFVEADILYSVELDASKMTAGIYFYQLVTPVAIHTKKLVVLK